MTTADRAQRAATVRVIACQGCGACLLTCPEHALRPMHGDGAPATIDVLAERCTGCGECVEVCPVDAISFDTPDAGGSPCP